MRTAVAVVACCAALAGTAVAADSGPARTVTIRRATVPPVIDGKLDDAVWSDVPPISDFHQQGPNYRAPPTEETHVRVTYDEDYFYIGAKLLDREAGKIRATQLIQGGAISPTNRFWCTLDTFNSKRNDYYFEVNPNGVRGEALRENNSKFIPEWHAIWNAASRIEADGRTMEMAIPFKTLSLDTTGGIWRINCGRWIIRKQEHDLLESTNRLWWAVDSRELYGVSDVRQGVGLDVSLSATLVHHEEVAEDRASSAVQPSGDLYYRLTPSLTAA